MITGVWDVGLKGTINSSKPLTIQGVGWGNDNTDANVGTIIRNSGTDTIDSPAIKFFSNGIRMIRNCIVKDLLIEHEGGTSFAIVFDESIYNYVDNITVYCNNLGYGGINYTDSGGNSLGSYFSIVNRSVVRKFTGCGIKVSACMTRSPEYP